MSHPRPELQFGFDKPELTLIKQGNKLIYKDPYGFIWKTPKENNLGQITGHDLLSRTNTLRTQAKEHKAKLTLLDLPVLYDEKWQISETASGTLKDLLGNPKLRSYLPDIFAQLLFAMSELHKMDLVHRHPSLDNILVYNLKGTPYIKLSDLSQTVSSTDSEAKHYIDKLENISAEIKGASDKKKIDCYLLGTSLKQLIPKGEEQKKAITHMERLIEISDGLMKSEKEHLAAQQALEKIPDYETRLNPTEEKKDEGHDSIKNIYLQTQKLMELTSYYNRSTNPETIQKTAEKIKETAIELKKAITAFLEARPLEKHPMLNSIRDRATDLLDRQLSLKTEEKKTTHSPARQEAQPRFFNGSILNKIQNFLINVAYCCARIHYFNIMPFISFIVPYSSHDAPHETKEEKRRPSRSSNR